MTKGRCKREMHGCRDQGGSEGVDAGWMRCAAASACPAPTRGGGEQHRTAPALPPPAPTKRQARRQGRAGQEAGSTCTNAGRKLQVGKSGQPLARCRDGPDEARSSPIVQGRSATGQARLSARVLAYPENTKHYRYSMWATKYSRAGSRLLSAASES